MQLSAKRVATLAKRPGRYHDGHGLILVVVNANNASWQLRFQRNGRERWLGLGPLHTVTLRDARERARAARLQLLDGIDPIDVRRAERAKATQVMTFKAAAQAYNALHEPKWRNAKHRKQFLASLACYAYPVLGDMTVSAIDTAAVLRVVEPIWLTKTETANRVRGRIESVLDWATVRGHRSGDNPARWKGHLAGVLPAPGAVARRSHYPALPIVWARACSTTWFGCAVASAAQSLNVLRKPWTVTSHWSICCSTSGMAMLPRPAPVRAPMNTWELPSSRWRPDNSSIAFGDKGTRCSRRDFIRAAGMTQV